MKKRIEFKWYFLTSMILAYIVIVLVKPVFFFSALKLFLLILVKLIPILVFVFLILFMLNIFVTKDWLVKKLENNKGIKAWTFAVVSGIISSGPIYAWYPLLSELKGKGLKNGLIATFLYARAVKPALIPLMVVYFGLAFTIILTLVMVIFSVIQGEVLERIMEVRK